MAEPRVAKPQQAAETAAGRLSDSVAAVRDYVERYLSKEGEEGDVLGSAHSCSDNERHLRRLMWAEEP